MGVLRKDQVAERVKDTSVEVPIPELGGEVRVIKPPPHLSVAFFAALEPYADKKGNIDITPQTAVVMAEAAQPILRFCVRDADNEKLFEGDVGERLYSEIEPSTLTALIKAIPTSKKKESSRSRDRRKPTKTAAKKKRATAKKKTARSKSRSSRPSKCSDSTSQLPADTHTPTT